MPVSLHGTAATVVATAGCSRRSTVASRVSTSPSTAALVAGLPASSVTSGAGVAPVPIPSRAPSSSSAAPPPRAVNAAPIAIASEPQALLL